MIDFNSIVREVAIGGDAEKGANPIKLAKYIKDHLENSSVELYGDTELITYLSVEAKMDITEYYLGQQSFDINVLKAEQFFIGVFGLGRVPDHKVDNLKEILSSECAGNQLYYMVCFRNKLGISFCDSNEDNSWDHSHLFSSLEGNGYYYTGMGILVSFPTTG